MVKCKRSCWSRAFVCVLSFAAATAWGGPVWRGEELKDWTRKGHQIKSVAVEGNRLKVQCNGTDGHLYSSTFDLKTTAEQYLVFRARGPHGGTGEIFWMPPGKGPTQKQSCSFAWRDDNDWHTYYVHLPWAKEGHIGQIRLDFPASAAQGGAFEIEEIAVAEEEPEIPAELRVGEPQKQQAFLRPNQPFTATLRVANLGTLPAEKVTVAATAASPHVQVGNVLPKTVWGCDAEIFQIPLTIDRPGTYPVSFDVTFSGAKMKRVDKSFTVENALELPKASYVPAPQPVETDYDLAALYFPGWSRSEAWARVWKVCPERRPVLGWYDEANPECIDWQIKWLVENGIRTLYVDWYWDRGSIHHEHWIEAFRRAKYRRHLKWAMMWANHNAPGSHSEADQRAVTKFWIDHYFNMPEYLQIDGKPVVWIWQAENMNRDVPDGGCRKLLEISREMARAAGYKGIYFLAMKWPEADCSAATSQKYKDFGFDETGIYHFMHHGGRAQGSRYAFKDVAAANPDNWWKQHEANVLPFLPNLSTGWDDRPWNNHCEIYGKNADDFRAICAAAKTFADKTGRKRLCLSPLNEWGEGSYAEPNGEHGFAFYEAVRDTFCKKPATGWPLNYAPEDVGLGPYDLPPPPQLERRTSWDFTDGKTHGWNNLMGITPSRLVADEHGLAFKTVTRDPAIVCLFQPFLAKDYKRVVVRMKVDAPKGAYLGHTQLFWATLGGSPTERTSCARPLVGDGAFHDYVFEVGANSAWRGRIGQFRFDPAGAPDLKITLASIRCF